MADILHNNASRSAGSDGRWPVAMSLSTSRAGSNMPRLMKAPGFTGVNGAILYLNDFGIVRKATQRHRCAVQTDGASELVPEAPTKTRRDASPGGLKSNSAMMMF